MQEHDVEKGLNGVKEKLSTAFIRLTRDREALIKTVKKLDIECTYCKHNASHAPCSGTDSNLECETCPHDCYCKGCVGNSKWEWVGEVGSDG